ncbi:MULTISPECIES: NADPH-dependent FMN reductase [unclassified Micromonospora]|uniref:NADPH-dependent FMN reductase n=1 Tax=unclassified Micromonospora TaxID=2617518 RepID=UPI001B361B15|nr:MULTISPECIES: NAD(P)H-dependent oxidoreductase [unclassified Micromonospora]MBQ1043956.1 NAD(P)H-dependent oxidoreductase [Micromonospora sp. C72]MBQ1054753.1 NAD(P)H-dependent oxidoreductase [Micromonospora sp. C32]
MTAPTAHPSHLSTAAAPAKRRVAVIASSVRDGRMSPTIAQWVVAALQQSSGVHVDLIDLAEITLPDDAQLSPGGGPRTEVADRIEAAEAFVFVTPEYNHSYPASLKRLIDWHYTAWMLKPATVVAYGVQGGYAAIEHLRGVLAELNMVTTRRCLGLAAPWEALDDGNRFSPADGTNKALSSALAELAWWTAVLTDARVNRPFPA